MRIGIRCSTFTKFPAELSCGRREKLAPVAREIDFTIPLKIIPVRHPLLFLPADPPGYRYLSFFVIGYYPPFIFVNNVNHSLSGLYQLPFLNFFPPGSSVAGSKDNGIRKIQRASSKAACASLIPASVCSRRWVCSCFTKVVD